MWLATKQGFFSVVRAHQGTTKKPHPNLMMIRARNKAHLENLLEDWPALGEVITTTETDYPYRLVATRDIVTAVLFRLVLEIDYVNFKNEAAANLPKDESYGAFLHKTWANGLDMTDATMHQRQWDERPYIEYLPCRTPGCTGMRYPNTNLCPVCKNRVPG